MKRFQVIIAPVFRRDTRHATQRFLRNTLILCAWSGARIRVISEKPSDEMTALISNLRSQMCCESVGCVVETAPPGEMVTFLKKIVEEDEADLLALNLEKGMMGRPVMSHDKGAVFLETNLPTLIIPGSVTFGYPPISSVLVAMAGERRQSEALRLAITLGNDNGLPVDLLHVTDNVRRDENGSMLGNISDEFQHEYPGMVQEFIAEASPFSTEKEKRCIRHFWHMRGDVSHLIRERMGEDRGKLLVLEWKGSLRSGRAEVLRAILRHAGFPVLLVRPEVHGYARLRIGKDFPLAG